MAKTDAQVPLGLPPVGWGQELSSLLDLARDLELDASLNHVYGHEAHWPCRSPLASGGNKGRMHRQIQAQGHSPQISTPEEATPTRKLFGEVHSRLSSAETRPPTAPEASSRMSRPSISQDGSASCSSRTASALRQGTACAAESSCPMHWGWSNEGGNIHVDPETPEGYLLSRRTHGHGSPQSDFMSGIGCAPRAFDHALWGEDELSSHPSQQSFAGKSSSMVGGTWSKRQLLKHPVLAAKSIERSLSRPGAPPGIVRSRAFVKKREDPYAFASTGSFKPRPPQQAQPPERARPVRRRPKKFKEALPEVQREMRPDSQASVRETDRAACKTNIFRAAYDKATSELKTDRAELARWRLDVAKAAEGESLKQVVKFRDIQSRHEQIFRLQAFVHDKDIQPFFEVGKNHQPKDRPYSTPTPAFQRVKTDRPVIVNLDIKMPYEVNSRQAIEPPKLRDEPQHEESGLMKGSIQAEVTHKHKQGLKARLKILQRVGRERQREEKSRNEQCAKLEHFFKQECSDSDDDGAKAAEGHGRRSSLRALQMDMRKQDKEEAAREMRENRRNVFNDALAAYQGKEKKFLETVFDKQDEDRSNTLDIAELRTCLVATGLRGKNEPERQAIRGILWSLDGLHVRFDDFIDIVPQVRSSLHELRKPGILQLFASLDNYGRSVLSIDDAVNGLRRLGIPMREEVCAEVTKAYVFQNCGDFLRSTREPSLAVDAFVKYVTILLEHLDRDRYDQFQSIVLKYVIGPKLQERWRRDLVEVHAEFHEYEPASGKYGSSGGSLSEGQVITVMRESGYMPKNTHRQQRTRDMVHELKRRDGTLGFMEYLDVMHNLRVWDCDRLRRICEGHPQWAEGMLTIDNIYEVLPACGLIPRTNDEANEVQAMIEEFDEDGTGVLSCDESTSLLQQLNTKFRFMQHERERQYVVSAGWSELNFAEFRQAFWNYDEDMSEILDRDELNKAVDQLRGSYSQSSSMMDLMLVALGIDPTKEIQVNFLMYLRMLKMLDDSEGRRQQGLVLGFTVETSDTLYSVFQALEPESDGTAGRELLQRVIITVLKAQRVVLSEMQIEDLLRMVSQEPLQVEFPSFLRLMKVINDFQELEFEDVVSEMFNWTNNPNQYAT